MSTFDYRARNLAGELVTGNVEAETRQGAVSILRSRDLFVVNISRPRRFRKKIHLLEGKVGVRELAIFCRQFAIMIDAGIPLMQCLRVLGDQTPGGPLKRIVSEAVVSLEKGKSLSEAFDANRKYLPVIFINMLAAAEVSGSLEITLLRLAGNLEKELQVKEKIKSALAYPVLVAVVALLAAGVMLLYVVPVFVDIFDQVGAALPVSTRLLLAISGILQRHSLVLVISLPLLFIAFKCAQKSKTCTVFQDLLLLRLPGVRSVTTGSTVSRFARTLSLLMKSGIPLLESLVVVEKVIENSVAAREIAAARRVVEGGDRIAAALRNSKVFPPMVVSMIAIGEESGALEQILEKLSHFYDQDVESGITRLASLLEPMLITGVGVMVGFIALSIYLPLFGLSGSLQP